MEITGYGIFTWDSAERRSDRYGSFTLDKINYERDAYYADAAFSGPLSLMQGHRVKIIATVLETRHSGHVGDLYHGIYPSQPETGEDIVVGIGTFFTEVTEWSASLFSVGVVPDNGRSYFWLDPKVLYRLHDQTVKIKIVLTNEDACYIPEPRAENNEDEYGAMMLFQDDYGQYKREA